MASSYQFTLCRSVLLHHFFIYYWIDFGSVLQCEHPPWNKRHSHIDVQKQDSHCFWLVSFILFTLHQLHHIVCWITILLRPLLQDLMLHMLWTSLHQSSPLWCFALVVCPARVIMYHPQFVILQSMATCVDGPHVLLPIVWIFIMSFYPAWVCLEPSSLPSHLFLSHSFQHNYCLLFRLHVLPSPVVVPMSSCQYHAHWHGKLFSSGCWFCDFLAKGVLTIWLTFWYYSPVPIWYVYYEWDHNLFPI